MLNAPVPYSDPICDADLSWDNGRTPLPPDPRRSLDHALHTIWRRRWYFLAVFGAVAMVGVLVLLVLPLQYTAQAIIMVGAREANPLMGEQTVREPRQAELDIDGEIQLITSPAALRRVVHELKLEQRREFEHALHGDGTGLAVRLRSALFGNSGGAAKPDPADIIARELSGHLKLERVGRSALVNVAYTAAEPAFAAEIANAVAGNTAVDEAFVTRLTVTEQAGFDLLRAWVVSPATVPAAPSSPNVLVVGLAAVVAGLGAAFSVVLLLEYYANRTILSADQFAHRGVRALGLIPDLGKHASSRRSAVTIIAEQPGEAFTESIAALQASLVPLVPQNSPACLVLLFASALPFEGKSTTIAALATSIARNGGRVLLIDADLRSPTLHRAFDASCARGVSNCLNADVELDSLIQVDPGSGVSLLAAGPPHPRPLEVLGSLCLRKAIEDWRKSFDFILIDAPPVLPIADARILVPAVDYCVFVARWRKTGWETAVQGLRLLTESGARIAGMAVSRVDVGQFATYGFPESGIYGRSYRQYAPNATREEQR
jgi:capsular exopolysaccharide synthesis family protein